MKSEYNGIFLFRHLDTTMFGDYPQTMKDIVGHRLPKFTTEQIAKLKNSADFVGINYYTSTFSKHLEKPNHAEPKFKQDSLVEWKSKFFFLTYLPENANDFFCLWY